MKHVNKFSALLVLLVLLITTVLPTTCLAEYMIMPNDMTTLVSAEGSLVNGIYVFRNKGYYTFSQSEEVSIGLLVGYVNDSLKPEQVYEYSGYELIRVCFQMNNGTTGMKNNTKSSKNQKEKGHEMSNSTSTR